MDDEDEECTPDGIQAWLSFSLRRATKSLFRLPGSVDRILLSWSRLMGTKAPRVGISPWTFMRSRIGTPRKILIVLALLAFFAFLLGSWQLHDTNWQRQKGGKALYSSPGESLPRYWSATTRDGAIEGVTDFERPANLSIVGLVFYGRPAVVSVLDCYLKVSFPRK